MTGRRVQLIIADPFEHDLVQTDSRNPKPCDRRSGRDLSEGSGTPTRHTLTRERDRRVGLLLLPLAARSIGVQRAYSVLPAGVSSHERARDTQARSDGANRAVLADSH
jgi:hypothetical protein